MRCFFLAPLLLFVGAAHAATNIISDQPPGGMTLADYGLGVRPKGDSAVQLKELAALPGKGQVQQIVPRGDALHVVLKEGRIWEYDLSGQCADAPLLDVDAARPAFHDAMDSDPSSGLRGFAFHPDFESNGLAYTLHREDPDGSEPDYGTHQLNCEFVLAEWNFHARTDGVPAFRLLFRIRMEHDRHTAQHIGFNPEAKSGNPEYGLLYACFGDNGASTHGSPALSEAQLREQSDVSNVGQDFDTIQAGVIRIDPLNPSGLTDGELAAMGRKRAPNGNFSIPLDNPFVGLSGHKEELFAKGFRNPLTLSFSPGGAPVVADVGEQTMEEINVLVPGGNYGWPVREGSFLVPWCDQVDGAPLGADDSMRWLPEGTAEDPAVLFYVRDKDQTNLRQETLARSGPHDDGFQYPVFQFSHEGNNSTGTVSGSSAVAGGDYYSGFWCEELEGKYLFGNISTDQLFYGASAALDAHADNAEVKELPLVDANGNPTSLAAIVGYNRANMRFGKDRHGNLYLASKSNRKLYRFQGTPKVMLRPVPGVVVAVEDRTYFEFSLDRPPQDGSITYSLEVTEDLLLPFIAADDADYSVMDAVLLPNGMERVRYRCLLPTAPGTQRFFRFSWE